MYTLNKAKQEIDQVAKHATEIAAHVLAMGGTVESRLESFKADILAAMETKFAELARSIHGEAETVETSAVADLGAKVSLLTPPPPPPEPEAHGAVVHEMSGPSDGYRENEWRPPEDHDRY